MEEYIIDGFLSGSDEEEDDDDDFFCRGEVVGLLWRESFDDYDDGVLFIVDGVEVVSRFVLKFLDKYL